MTGLSPLWPCQFVQIHTDPETASTDRVSVDDGVWTFGRREERLILRREKTEDGVSLIVTENGTPRSFPFSDLERLVAFQSDMEAFLVRSGWSLLEFSPERRTGRDRRRFPRLTERRRWWTDGAGTPLPTRSSRRRRKD